MVYKTIHFERCDLVDIRKINAFRKSDQAFMLLNDLLIMSVVSHLDFWIIFSVGILENCVGREPVLC